jgi:hypothetical protein
MNRKPILIILIITLSLLHGFNLQAQILMKTDSVIIMNYEVHHQGINHLDINIKYNYISTRSPGLGPIPSILARDLDSILVLYPNTTDWWEIVNKKITAFYMNHYPGIDSLSSNILVHWTSGAGVEYGHKYPTRSITCRTRAGKLYEYFGFTTMPGLMKVKHAGKNYKVFIDLVYQYKNGIKDTEYPDGLATEKYFKKLLREQAVASKDWDDAVRKASFALTKKFAAIRQTSTDLSVYEGKKRITELKIGVVATHYGD